MSDKDFETKLAWLSPENFISRGGWDIGFLDRDRVEKYKEMSSESKVPAFMLIYSNEETFDTDEKIASQGDGFHRATALKELGVKRIPVHVAWLKKDNEKKDSKHEEESTPEQKEKNFKKWFGNSKVVNEDGSPKVMYHGSTEDFKEFDKEKQGSGANLHGKGFYFTSTEESARSWGNKTLFKVFLKVENPLDSRDAKTWQSLFDEYIKENKIDLNETDYPDFYKDGKLQPLFERLAAGDFADRLKELSKKEKEKGNDVQDQVDFLQSKGYDGIKVSKDKTKEYIVVFESNQIKSVDNQGTYSEDSNDIEKGKGAQIGEIREWSGKKYQKTEQGWKPVKGEKKSKKEEDTPTEKTGKQEEEPEQKQYSEEELSQHARAASTEDLKRHADSGDEKMRVAAKNELHRRGQEEDPEKKQELSEKDNTESPQESDTKNNELEEESGSKDEEENKKKDISNPEDLQNVYHELWKKNGKDADKAKDEFRKIYGRSLDSMESIVRSLEKIEKTDNKEVLEYFSKYGESKEVRDKAKEKLDKMPKSNIAVRDEILKNQFNDLSENYKEVMKKIMASDYSNPKEDKKLKQQQTHISQYLQTLNTHKQLMEGGGSSTKQHEKSEKELNPTCSYPLLNSGKSSLSFLKNSNLFTTDFFRMKGAYLYPSAS